MKSFKFYLLGLSLLSVMFASCGDDDMTEGPAVGGQTYDNGVLIVNEGVFGGVPGTIDYYDRTKDSLLRNVYSSVNDGQVIGSVLQSVTVIGENAYLVANNSAKIEVVDAATMEYKNTIANVFSPRYIVSIGNNEAVVSEWGLDGFSGQLKLIDLTTMTVTDSVSVNGPEQMVVSEDKIYVANSGGWGESDEVTIHGFDLAQESVVTVGKRTINMVQDVNGAIWVLSGGSYVTNEGASLCRIVNGEVGFCKDLMGFPGSLISDGSGSNLYFIENNRIQKLDIGNEETNISILAPFVSGTIYGLGYDGIDNSLYAAAYGDFTSESTTYVIADGDLVKEFTTGVATNSFVVR